MMILLTKYQQVGTIINRNDGTYFIRSEIPTYDQENLTPYNLQGGKSISAFRLVKISDDKSSTSQITTLYQLLSL